jgi:hypothetical protein
MRYILIALALMVGAFAQAGDSDDIKKFVREQANPTPKSVSPDTSIKEYARYQRERLRTYAEAVDQHNKTKCKVIVWVGFTDGDDLFKMWQQTKDLGYHVFVPDFDGVYTGVVVGMDIRGSFARLEVITNDYVERIKKDCAAVFTPQPQFRPSVTVPQFQFSTPSCTTGR